MISGEGKNSGFWKFIGGNFSIYVGIIENITLLNINGNTHYKFDLRILSRGPIKKVIKDIISCPYLQLEESEHRLMFEKSRVTVIGKFTPIVWNINRKIIFSGKTIALKVENNADVYFKLSKRIF